MKYIQSILILIITSLSAYGINPMKEYKMKPDVFNIEYEEQKLKTQDGYELNMWVMKPKADIDKNITIVIAGSDAGNMGFNLPYAFHLLNSGYKVVTFDYRGFGESSEFDYNPNNVYHTEYIIDFKAVVEWCKKELEQDRIGVMSFSMGTLVASVGHSSSNFDFLIAEGFITSPKINKQRVEEMKEKVMLLPKSAKDDEESIDKLNIPTLLFASKNDKITTAKDCHEFCDHHKLAETIEYDGDHLRGAASLGFDVYIGSINNFISKYE